MSIPKPNPKETSEDFISRCMSWMHDSPKDSKKPKEQQLAMCYSALRESRGKGVAPEKKEELEMKEEKCPVCKMEDVYSEIEAALKRMDSRYQENKEE